MAKKMTITQRRKESLLRQVRRMEQKGYVFAADIRQEIKNLSPQKARFYNTETLYKKADWLDRETGEVKPALKHRAEQRKETARKAAETRRRKKQRSPQPLPEDEEPYDVTEDVLEHFEQLVRFFDSPIPPVIITQSGKTVPKPPKIASYEYSVKNYIREVFNQERAKDPVALAYRLYQASAEIDELIGVLDYSGYMEAIRTAGNRMIAIIRGTSTLSMEDRKRSEEIANDEAWEDEV